MDTVHLDVKWDGMDTLVMRRVVMDVYLVHVPKKMDPAVVNRTGQEINVTVSQNYYAYHLPELIIYSKQFIQKT